MKAQLVSSLALILGATHIAQAAPAKSFRQECRVVSVVEEQNFAEEGLGVYGRPNIDTDAQTIGWNIIRGKLISFRIGHMRYATDKGDKLQVSTDGEITTYAAVRDGFKIKIRHYLSSERGVVLIQEDGDASSKLLTFDCSDAELAKTIKYNDARVKKIKGSSIPAIVRKEMANSELTVEMGDGYYSLIKEVYYKIVSEGQVVGYLLEATLQSTEFDTPEVVTARFDRNGLRLNYDELN